MHPLNQPAPYVVDAIASSTPGPTSGPVSPSPTSGPTLGPVPGPTPGEPASPSPTPGPAIDVDGDQAWKNFSDDDVVDLTKEEDLKELRAAQQMALDDPLRFGIGLSKPPPRAAFIVPMTIACNDGVFVRSIDTTC